MKFGLVCVIAICAVSSRADTNSGIEGLWYGALKPDDGALINIDVSLNDRGAEIEHGSATLTKNRLHLVFDTGAVFSGQVSSTHEPIHGFYIQPANQVGGQRLAHPTILLAKAGQGWIGTAAPLARQFTIFMSIERNADQALVATLLNPQRNVTGPARQYLVVGNQEDGYSLQLERNGSEFTPIDLGPSAQTLRMDFGPINDFELKRIAPEASLADAFFGEHQSRELSAPLPNGAWPVGSLEQAGFDRSAITQLVAHLARESGLVKRPSLIHSLLVAKDGKLVIEEYFRNETQDTPHDVRSAGKTFSSILVGALIQDGFPLRADTPINQFIEVPNETDGLPVTLAHLLTHQSGLDCYDGSYQTAGHEDVMWQQQDSLNFWKYIADLKFVAPPGTKYAYCSGGINLIGAALAGVSEETVLTLIRTKLFEPLGFKNAFWNVMPNGEAYLGGGAHLRTRDLAKIGQLYLDKGKWQGRQIIDANWTRASITSKVEITPSTTGLDESAFSNFYFGGRDGYAWHLHTISVGAQTYESYEASGNGGQMVVVVPELDIVVAITGGNYGEGFTWGNWRQEIIGAGIIASLVKQ